MSKSRYGRRSKSRYDKKLNKNDDSTEKNSKNNPEMDSLDRIIGKLNIQEKERRAETLSGRTRKNLGKLRGGHQEDGRDDNQEEYLLPQNELFKPYWHQSFQNQGSSRYKQRRKTNKTSYLPDSYTLKDSRNSLINTINDDDDDDKYDDNNDDYSNDTEYLSNEDSPENKNKPKRVKKSDYSSANSSATSDFSFGRDDFSVAGNLLQAGQYCGVSGSILANLRTKTLDSSSDEESDDSGDGLSSEGTGSYFSKSESRMDSDVSKLDLETNSHPSKSKLGMDSDRSSSSNLLGRILKATKSKGNESREYQGEFQEDFVNMGNTLAKISIVPNRNLDPITEAGAEDEYSTVDEVFEEPNISTRKATPVGKLMCWRGDRKKEIEKDNEIQEESKILPQSMQNQSRKIEQRENGNIVVKEVHDSVIPHKKKEEKWKSYIEKMQYQNQAHSYFTYEYEKKTPLEVSYEEFGGIDSSSIAVNVGNLDLLRTKNGEVILQIEASTISYTDCRIRKGELWKESLNLPITPGVDLVGKIYHIKMGTSFKSGLKKGDRVISLAKTGGNARYMKISTEQLVKIPLELRAEEAVCLAEAYLSAFQGIHYGETMTSRYKDTSLCGKSILVVGALTNAGQAVIELAKIAGVTLIYAPCKMKHKDRIFELGATPLERKKEEWMPLLEGKIDLIIDTTTDLESEIRNYFNALQDHGYYVLVGRSKEDVEASIISEILPPNSNYSCSSKKPDKMDQVFHYNVFEKWDLDIELCKRDLDHLVKLLSAGLLSPRILDRISLHKVKKAHEILEEKRLKGFLVCEPFMKSKSRAVYL